MANQINDGTPLRFPIDHSPFHRSLVKFQAMKVDPPGLNLKFKPVENPGLGSAIVNTELSGSLDKNTDLEQGFRKAKINPINGDVANIHLPMSFAVNDNLEYSGADFKMGATIAAASAFEQGNDARAAVIKAIQETGKSFLDFFQGQKALTGTAATLSALRAGEAFATLGASGISNTLSVVGRVALHPNIRNRFTGVSLRSFTFAFKFLPKSRRESEAVKKIVKFFRFHAYPQQIPPNTSFGIGYEYPSLFKIQLLSGAGGMFEHVGTPIKFSYLRSISTNYNPTTPVLHDDGSPTEVDLSLSFTEYKTLHREDIVNEDDLEKFYDQGGALAGTNLNTTKTTKLKAPATNTANTSRIARGMPADPTRSGIQ